MSLLEQLAVGWRRFGRAAFNRNMHLRGFFGLKAACSADFGHWLLSPNRL